MHKVFIAALLTVISCNVFAAFACEQIKDKPVRAACIADRDKKEKDELVAKEKAAAEEKLKAESAAIEAEKNKELDEFVRKSKALLTKNFKDPAGAQYTDLVVVQDKIQRSLCGSVNGKNSYGGFVGAKRFYVSWMPILGEPRTWIEFESTSERRRSRYADVAALAADVEAAEARIFALNCEPSDKNTVTKIDK